MVLKSFPDLQWLRNQADTHFKNRQGASGRKLETEGWPNVILNASATAVTRDNIRGPLSIFTNRNGLSTVTVDRRRVTVSPKTFFLSNQDQSYTLEVGAPVPTETFNIHFGEHFLKSGLEGHLSTVSQLLENKTEHVSGIEFYNRLVPASEDILQIFQSIANEDNDVAFEEEQLFQLLGILLKEEKKLIDIKDNLSPIRTSTKEAILRQLTLATDYLYTYYDSNPSLDELARESCLSKFHFLRLFKIGYGKTPHQSATDLKIQRAKELLKTTNHEVRTIADTLGFDNSSTFSRLFHQRMGVYPSQFRACVQ